jgi:hypothetical protein
MQIQIQIGGKDNDQVLQQVAVALSTLLNQTEENLRQRSFACSEVKSTYIGLLARLSVWINNQESEIFKSTAFMMYPFKSVPEDGAFRSQDFVEAFLETLTLIGFSDVAYKIESDHLNFRVNGSQTCGLYYHPSGQNDLVGSFVRLVKCLKDRNVILPESMIFIILRCIGGDSYLEVDKIRNILDASDILGNDPYIKPLQTGSPKCVNLTSYIIDKCTTLDEAKDFIKGIISIV